MNTYKLTYVNRTQRTSKAGKPFTSLSIKTDKHGDRFLGGFGNKDNESWQVGDSVEIDVVENGQYLNFEMPKKAGGFGNSKEVVDKLDTIILMLKRMEVNGVRKDSNPHLTSSGTPVPFGEVKFPDEDIDVNQIPF